MMNGKPQTLTSKFKISYNLLLNLIDIGDKNLVGFAKKSMVTDDLTSKMKHVSTETDKCKKEIDRLNLSFDTMRTPRNIVEEYCEIQEKKDNYANKKRKEFEKEIQKIKDNNKFIDQDLVTIQKYNAKILELEELQKQYDGLNNYINNDVEKVLYLLREEGFLVTLTRKTKVSEVSVEATIFDDKVISETTGINEVTIVSETIVSETTVEVETLTLKGKMASQLREVHCLVFARLLEDGILYNLSSRELIALFSCVTNISVSDEYKDIIPCSENTTVNITAVKVYSYYDYYESKETELRINTGIDYNLHFDILDYVLEWTECECIEDCKILLQKMEYEKGIFLGEFVKAILKINNVAAEMEKIAEMTGNIEFLSKLREIPGLTLKFVVTNQSLYI
jgi:cupin superfamily acireductone dioxygenase involved in methionine salvage